MDTIVLAGGFGKRLKNSLNNIPKPMAIISGRPFLDYLFDFLIKNDINKIILSVYYKSEVIKNHYNSKYKSLKIVYCIDQIPLGTGGAILSALKNVSDDNVLIVNGDTFFDISLKKLINYHISLNNDITLSLKNMKNFDRYGFVKVQKDGKVLSFEEKKFQNSGVIDGGIYLIKKNIFRKYIGKKVFLFGDFLKDYCQQLQIGSLLFNDLFIDIGTPEDLANASKILREFK